MGKSKHVMEASNRGLKTPKKSADNTKDETKRINEATSSGSDSEEDTAPGTLKEVKNYIKALPSTDCIKGLFKDFSTTIKEELSEIRSDIREIASRTNAIEESTNVLINHAEHTEKIILSQRREIYRMKLQIDDLENRSRRNNIRLKGLPETVLDKDIHAVLTQLFNELLQQDESTELFIERAHRVYRPKHIQSDIPRDVLCCLQSFRTKENILQKARMAKKIEWENREIFLYQDISRFTLYVRSLLQPLTKELRNKNIKYRWLFPLGLLITHLGRSFTIKTPEDIPPILAKLSLEDLQIKDWTLLEEEEAQFPILPTRETWQTVTPTQAKRQRMPEKIFPKTPSKSQRVAVRD